MLHFTKSTNVSKLYYFFIIDILSVRPDEMSSWARWNGFVGRILNASRS